MGQIIPKEDPFWTFAESTQYKSPKVEISVENEYAGFLPSNPESCYKCGVIGHFTFQCDSRQNSSIKPKRKNRRPKKKISKLTSGLGRGYVRCLSHHKENRGIQ
jgi:hypothetical protein